MTSTPDSDALAVAAHDVALAALHEITAPATVGEAAGYGVESDGTVSLRFANRLPGYPGWFWTVSVGQVDGSEPTVLEAELLPGDDALLAPDWVPWADRLADYHAHQAELAAAAAEAEDDDSDDDESDDDEDDRDLQDEFEGDDFEGDGFADDADDDDSDDLDVDDLHDDGDVDGVDIDALDDDEDESDEDESDDEDDDTGHDQD